MKNVLTKSRILLPTTKQDKTNGSGDVLVPAVDGFVLIERKTPFGLRPGIMASMDLEQYDANFNLPASVRPAESWSFKRLHALLRERPEITVEHAAATILIDDPGQTVIESLYARRNALRPLYDLDSAVRGWAVEDANADSLLRALNAIGAFAASPAYLAVNGYDELAAAKQYWNTLRESIPLKLRENHPLRYALVELVNASNTAVAFEPVYCLVSNVNPLKILGDFRGFLKSSGLPDVAGNDLSFLTRSSNMSFGFEKYPLPALFKFLNAGLQNHPEAHTEFISNEDVLREKLQENPSSVAFVPRALKRNELFATVRKTGPLPENAFTFFNPADPRLHPEARSLREAVRNLQA